MMYRSIIAKLETVADLSQEDLAPLLAVAGDVRTVPAKRDIISEGERPEHVHVIADGRAARYTTLPNGSRQIVALLIPGDFCDLHVAILGKMDHAITALTRCRIAYIPSSALDALTSSHNPLTKAMWWASLVDEAVLRSWIVNNGRRTAYQRIAHLLCELHLRMSMVGLVNYDRFDLPLTQDILADAVGLTAVHTNRTLQKLRSEQLIELHGGTLSVLDVEKLREAAGFDPSYLHIKRRSPNPR